MDSGYALPQRAKGRGSIHTTARADDSTRGDGSKKFDQMMAELDDSGSDSDSDEDERQQAPARRKMEVIVDSDSESESDSVAGSLFGMRRAVAASGVVNSKQPETHSPNDGKRDEIENRIANFGRKERVGKVANFEKRATRRYRREEESEDEAELSVDEGKEAEVEEGYPDYAGQGDIPMEARQKFVHRPVSREGLTRCYIERDRGGTNRLNPIYRLFDEKNSRFWLSAKKRLKNKTSNFMVALEHKPSVDCKSTAIAGKVRGNWERSSYSIYDHGLSWDKTKNEAEVRKTMGAIRFHRGNYQGQDMSIAIPVISKQGQPTEWREMKDSECETMADCVRSHSCEDMLIKLHSRKPKGEDGDEWTLKFHGRKDVRKSTKNFQLVCEDEPMQVLQFGRLNDSRFFMDFKHPLSPFQAFTIVMATLDQ
jgi:hypothetical protein